MNTLAKKVLKRFLARAGLSISRAGSTTGSSALGYISTKATLASAEQAGLSVCDYVENLWSQQGCTQKVVDRMTSFGAFGKKIRTSWKMVRGRDDISKKCCWFASRRSMKATRLRLIGLVGFNPVIRLFLEKQMV